MLTSCRSAGNVYHGHHLRLGVLFSCSLSIRLILLPQSGLGSGSKKVASIQIKWQPIKWLDISLETTNVSVMVALDKNSGDHQSY